MLARLRFHELKYRFTTGMMFLRDLLSNTDSCKYSLDYLQRSQALISLHIRYMCHEIPSTGP